MKKSLKILLVITVFLAVAILFSANVKAANEPTIEMEVKGNGVFYVGYLNEFTISTTVPDDKKEEYEAIRVVGTGKITDESGKDATYALDELDYYNTATGNEGWFNLKGQPLGPTDGTGFPLTNSFTRFQAKFNKAGKYNVEYQVQKVENGIAGEVIVKNTLEIEVKEPSISMEVNGNFHVGEPQEFSISTLVPEGYPETTVYGAGSITNPEALEKLEYLEEKDGKWHVLPAGENFGPLGFPLKNATSKFRATFKKAGNYTVKFNVTDVNNSKNVIAQNSLDIEVFDTVDNQIKNETGNVVDVTASEKEAISKELLNKLKNGSEKDINIHLDTGITISFNTKNIVDEFTKDLSLDINVTEEKPFEAELTGFESAELLYIDIEYSGVLPKDTKISFNVGDSYKIGDKVYLYYCNPSTGKAELISNNIVIGQSGIATISVDHASTYFLSKTALQADDVNNEENKPAAGENTGSANTESEAEEPNVKTGDTVILMASSLMVIAIVGLAIVVKIKKL